MIRPTWRRHHREPGDVVLALDPGMAFGTGLHPTTRLCLAALESMADRGRPRHRDGRGAGARCRLGAPGSSRSRPRASARAGCSRVDVDPIAVEATRANARRNGLARRIRAREGSSPSGEGPFDVVLGNLIASVLIALADGLVEDLRPGGTLLASGIFENREADVVAAFRARGLEIETPLDRGRLGRARGCAARPERHRGRLRSTGSNRVAALRSGSDARPVVAVPGDPRDAHHAGDLPARPEPPPAVHAAQPLGRPERRAGASRAGSSAACRGPRRTGRSSSASASRSPGSR